MLTQTVEDYTTLSDDYDRIEQAILFLEANYQAQPSLSEVAASVHLSEYHFQRLFTRWVGISPKRFLQFLTKEHAKQLLAHCVNVLDAAYETGLSGPGRLHDLFVAAEAVTPGEFKSRGEGMLITYGFQPTPFGECLLALTERGICDFIFVERGDRDGALAQLKSRWQRADLRQDERQTQVIVRRIFSALGRIEAVPVSGNVGRPLSLYLCGTNFQIKVWEALLRIPPGAVVSYDDIAAHLGMPGAARAVGNAVASNPIPVIIPCHRVIRKVGDFGGYRYGTARKMALLGWEQAKVLEQGTLP
jgi:AraC family transcriptional regulator of adaptative response/methylated-DNA-[protein]-cysteine methyltransferase